MASYRCDKVLCKAVKLYVDCTARCLLEEKILNSAARRRNQIYYRPTFVHVSVVHTDKIYLNLAHFRSRFSIFTYIVLGYFLVFYNYCLSSTYVIHKKKKLNCWFIVYIPIHT